jgi:hypothetical protein
MKTVYEIKTENQSLKLCLFVNLVVPKEKQNES